MKTRIVVNFHLAMLAVALACAGCKSAGTHVETRQLSSENQPTYHAIAVSVSSKDMDFGPRYQHQLQSAIVSGLSASGRFDSISTDTNSSPAAPALRLGVQVQLFVAPNMGHVQSLEALATIANHEGHPVSSATIESHTAWSLWGRNTSQAITNLAAEVVRFSLRN